MTEVRDFINTTGAEKLRASMRYDSDPRWFDRPVDPPPQPDPVKRSVLWYWIAGAIVAVGAIAFARYARGAESADHMRPHEMVLLRPLPPADQPVPDVPYILTISGAYPDREACEKAKKGVRVPAGKVVCSIVNPFRVR